MISLEKLCLEIIVQNFEQLHLTFTLSKDKNLDRNFDFLRRRFSCHLATALHLEERMKEDYFKLLINEHLVMLNGNWFADYSQCLNSMESIFHHSPNLTKVCFPNCSDKILKELAKFCPKLIEIDIRNSEVTDNGVKYLCQNKNGMLPCPGLKNLFISGTSVTKTGAEFIIRNLPSLERLYYPQVALLLHSIFEINLFKLNKIQGCNLVELDLSDCSSESNYTKILKTCLTVCSKLESLICYISDKKQLDFFTKSQLKKLDLRVSDTLKKLNLNKFLKINGCNLTYLKLCNCSISVALLAVHCPVLKELDANNLIYEHNKMGGDYLQVNFPCLLKCSFSFTDHSSAKALGAILSSSPYLESVKFDCDVNAVNQNKVGFFKMKDEILKWCSNSSAKEILFDSCKLEIKFLKHILLNGTSLKAMYLFDCICDDSTDLLYELAKELPNKPYIFDTQDTCGYNTDELKQYIFLEEILHVQSNEIHKIYKELKKDYDSYFDDTIHNLEKDCFSGTTMSFMRSIYYRWEMDELFWSGKERNYRY